MIDQGFKQQDSSMELQGHPGKDIGKTSSLGYKKDSSSKSPIPINSSIVGEMIGDQGTVHGDNTIFNLPQTLDQHLPLYNPQLNPQSVSQSQPQPRPRPRPRQNLPNNKPRGSNPDADPDPATSSKETNRSSNRSPARTPTTSTAIIPVPTIRYRECLKNHAASRGSHVVDGCGEFMPSGEDGTAEALKCAACDCHRNFHHKEIDGESQSHYAPNSHYTCNNPSRNSTPRNTNTIPHHPPFHHRMISYTSHQTASIAPMMMNFGGVGTGGSSGGLEESSSEDLNLFQSSAGGQTSMQQPKKKKRFRSKFSQEQKEKMMDFAEKLGWRIQKQDDQEVQDFCTQVGVKRQVFKVWMHNNKQATKKKQDDHE